MGLLLHICCGPCASGTIPVWKSRGLEVAGFFFNPNIHPLLEWRRRATGARDVAQLNGVELVEDSAYDPEEWFATVAGGEGVAVPPLHRPAAHADGGGGGRPRRLGLLHYSRYQPVAGSRGHPQCR